VLTRKAERLRLALNGSSPPVAPRAPAHWSGSRLAATSAPGAGRLRPGGQLMNVRPLRDRILVKRFEEQEQKVGGIIIPDTAKEKPQQGKVIAAGNGRVNDEGKVLPLDVKAGNTILFGKYSGTEIKIEGEEYLILREDEVLGVIEG
jgi:chaperonin GroES